MVNIPVRFKRVAAAFDEMSRDRSFESSGSEHSADLSDLVNSFFEREIREQRIIVGGDGDGGGDDEIEIDEDESGSNSQDSRIHDSLRKIFDLGDGRSISIAVEKALEVVGDNDSSLEFKRRLMARLRSSGFDAGICKSKWEKSGSKPWGNYEYIDVNAGGIRYVVEVSLADKFIIARPTAAYAAMLDEFPAIFVGKPEEMKQLVRQMSKAIRKSLKSVGLNVPPWRRLSYMQAKWFGSYKRTTNEISRAEAFKDLGGKRLVGFATAAAPDLSFCRKDFAAKHGIRVGNLAAVLNNHEMLL
ncbi:hypothetical protein SASPL_121198 [Salvia splendens]|uniref:DUF506 family protein n=1 Tax=Salvia splendens TaxID=180675 RepID=A0A8X8XRZ2_SALSN|nr:uncharacterized protein LOC121741149 [Salvia splendens]KAG6418990.1 hypothetical protein SASPL_121198 [Salvia splendens]